MVVVIVSAPMIAVSWRVVAGYVDLDMGIGMGITAGPPTGSR